MIVQIIEERCDGCGRCDFACPMDVIYLSRERGLPEIRYGDDCMTCFNCELECPLDAIRVDPVKAEPCQPW